MTVSLDQFWELALDSGLFDPDECETLRKEFNLADSGDQAMTARVAAEWLVGCQRMTIYQAQTVLRGCKLPLVLGEYQILRQRSIECSQICCFDALHASTRHRVLIYGWNGQDDWEQAKAFAAESRHIRHPNLSRHYEVVELPTSQFVVAEYPPGQTCRQLLKQRKRLPPAVACRIVHQAAQGLAYLHARQRVHGQLRLGLVTVQEGGHVKLDRSPFPREPVRLEDLDGPKPDALVHYLAPEFLRDGYSPNPLTDIYGLGCFLYELLMGHPPYDGEGVKDVMQAHASRRVEELQSSRLPPGLGEVISFMMAKRWELRYQTIDEVVDKLDAYLPAGIQPTKPKSRPTETLFYSHLERQQAHREATPQHLTVASVDTQQPTVSDAPPVSIVIDAEAKSTRKITRWGRPLWQVVLPVTMLVVAGGSILWWAMQSPTPKPDQAPVTANGGSASSGVEIVPGENEIGVEVVDDDGRSLWASPTNGVSISIDYTPPGAQFFLFARISDLLATSDGATAVRALGPEFETVCKRFEDSTQISLEQISSILISFVSQDTTKPVPSLVVELDEPTRASVLAACRVEETPTGATGALGPWRVYFPHDHLGTLVLSTPQLMSAILEQPMPLMRRDLERLKNVTDQERSLTMLFAPSFLAADGKAMLSGRFERLRDQILSFLGERTQAATLSINLADSLYVELRWLTQVEEIPRQVAADRRRQMESFPELVNEFLGRMVIDSHWQPLAVRFPLMIHFLVQQTRFGVVDETAMMNAVLPPQAAHNLVLASELALTSRAHDRHETEGHIDLPQAAQVDLSTLLNLQMEEFFVAQQSMETAFDDLAELVRQSPNGQRFAIRIEGAEIQRDGITRNQQIKDIRLQQPSVREILNALVVRANPIVTPGLSDPAQKLVWVPVPANIGHELGVLITTRQAALQKGYKLPSEFIAE